MKLTLHEHERHDVVWKKVRAALVEELERLRKKNDATMLDPVQTAVIRGRIACIKDLITHGDGVNTGEDGA